MVDIGRERRSTRKLQPGWTVGGSTNDADSDFVLNPIITHPFIYIIYFQRNGW